MLEPSWSHALNLFESGDIQASLEIVQNELEKNPKDPRILFVAGHILLKNNNFAEAMNYFNASLKDEPDDFQTRYELALAYKGVGTFKDMATARDILIDLSSLYPDNVSLVREAAAICGQHGAADKCIELWKQAIAVSPDAFSYSMLSEQLAHMDRLAEAAESMQMAINLDPGRYGKSQEDIKLATSGKHNEKSAVRVKKGRYPETDQIQNDLRKAILDHVAADTKDDPKFITEETRFFTMGSCFANNVVRALKKSGYNAETMYTPEVINTSYANRYFADWLEGTLPPGELSDRILEMLLGAFSKEMVIERIKNCDVYIITMGVAPAFFDRDNGDFIMPRPTALNTRALAEKYLFRTTSVTENVQNVLHLLGYVRRLNPDVKIVVTVSPVPLHMTFEFKSAVMADCLSKSTLRVAANEIVHNSGLENIYYWPSFEIFRWIGSHLPQSVYGTDDGSSSHVSQDLVDLAISCFIEAFSAKKAKNPGK